MHTANVDPSRVLLVAQSLGTAVGMGVAATYAEKHPDAPLAGIVTIAAFTSLRKLLGSYRLGGVIPLLAPVAVVPGLLDWLLRGCLHAEFNSEERLLRVRELTRGTGFTVTLVHAVNDWEISVGQSRRLYEVAVAGEDVVEVGLSDCRVRRNERGDVRLVEAVWGGHNEVQKSDVVVRAVMDAWRVASVREGSGDLVQFN